MLTSGLSALPGIGILAFAVTDIDDLFVLVAFFAAGTHRPRQIVAGQYLGIAALIAASAASYFLRLVLSGEWIGLAGLLPLALGIREAVELLRERRSAASAGGGSDAEASALQRRSGLRGVVSVAAVTIANGGDNLGVYVPLFASSTPFEIALLAGVFLAMTGLWLLLAWSLVSNPVFGGQLRRFGRYALLVVLVALGVFVLLKQESWRLVAALAGSRP